ncbi:MAG: helix-turn-helix transcriptional regulator [Clostridia bacterium]|nr:helix-turn-helix transcriptional regulator [Clostridia bacterium]
MQHIDSDLIRGNIDTIILKTMLNEDKYGLDIIKEVGEKSSGTYELKQPTLYSCLKRLENQELISSYWLDSDIGGRRHYYKLTEKGKDSLLQKQEEWTKSKFIIDNLLSNHDYDEYRLVKKEDYEKIIEGKKFDYKPEESQQPLPAESQEELVDEFAEDTLTDEEQTYQPKETAEETFDDEIEEVETSFADEEPEEEIPSTPEKRIDYLDDNDDAEADYPNQKRFKIPSIYDKINIDEDEVVADEDNDYTDSIYSSYSTSQENEDDEDALDEEFSLESIDLDEDEINEITDEYTSLLEEEMSLGNSENEDDEDDRVYVRNYNETTYEEDDDDLDIPTNTLTNQTANEMNILSKLRGQEDDEINEYYGDKNSYINHLNKNDEIETLKSDDLNVVQEDLLSSDNYLSQTSINNQINELENAIKNLNEFGNDEPSYNNYEPENVEEDDELDSEIEEELITNIANQEESKDIIDFKQETNTDDYLNELAELKMSNNNGYFNSLDSADYSNVKDEYSPINFETNLESTQEDTISFDEQFESYNNQFGYNNHSNDDEQSIYSSNEETQDETSSFASFDDIISKNMNDYSSTFVSPSEEYKTFTPRFTENNYKQKLNNLSAYSKTSNDTQETANECVNNEEVMSKVKDIKTLKTEFASDGILVKEYRKSNGRAEEVERNYLLSNKLNLVKSLILLFGYVFVLSAVFIIMNNTSAQTIQNFSFKYFLIGFIPFIVYAIYHTVMFVISPYKKVPAKFAPRIMIFIAVIITIQLLLITYCLNLQMGFYSFSQSHYNHLLWVIPTIISFAPIISTLIHMALYYSKNFNV